MEIYREQQIKVIKEILVKVVCDVCGKEITESDKHYKITNGHNDWGNDSCDSIAHKDVCSDKCLKFVFDEYLNSSYKTKYIEIIK